MSQIIYLMFAMLLSLPMIVTCRCVSDQLDSTYNETVENETVENKTVEFNSSCSCAPVSAQLNDQTVVKKTEEFFCASDKLKDIINELIQVTT